MDLMEVYQYLTDEEKERYAALEETFASKGWRLLVEDAEQMVAYYQFLGANAGTWDANREALGARQTYERLVGMREATENEYAAKALERQQPQVVDEPEDDPDYE